jgi:hypothetical protein
MGSPSHATRMRELRCDDHNRKPKLSNSAWRRRQRAINRLGPKYMSICGYGTGLKLTLLDAI